tara:strand:+ start:84654 stop:86723 length:2070 start_codon:yes stop_codon:yes gene_type:complete
MTIRILTIALTGVLGAITASADTLEELLVTAVRDTRTIDVHDELVISADIAQLLKKAPGANVNSNGPLTGIPQYRGYFGPRIASSMDGSQLAPAGPNWMDPPISYAVGGQLESLEIYRGIVPVGVAQESIGGAIEAKTRHGRFSTSGEVLLEGQAMASAQSINNGSDINAAMYASSRQHRLKIAALLQQADDADFPGGSITPTQYERKRYSLGYGIRSGDHTLQFDYDYNDTGNSGTPALPMDINYFEGDLYKLSYNGERSGGITLAIDLYGSDLDHGMTNYHLRQAPPPSRWRRNIASSENAGFNVKVRLADSRGQWHLGVDGFRSAHDANIDNPKNPTFFVQHFNNASRDVTGVFLERETALGDYLTTELGIRFNRVEMNSDTVDGSPAMMPPGAQLRDAFNAGPRKQTDNNVDATAKIWLGKTEARRWFIGFARKSRSPSYQERYLWLPLESTAGLADGRTYTGNLRLDPEVSHQLEFGLDYSVSNLQVSPRVFYHRVDDYIQGTPSDIRAANMLVQMMNGANGTNNPPPLQFNNVDAQLYGFDMDYAWQVNDSWRISGLINYVRGKNTDLNDNLYRIAPLNGSLQLTYSRNQWTAAVEGIAYAAQDKVSQTNSEQKTSGYGVINVNAAWQISHALQVAIGIDNLFDRRYSEHLGGYNRAANPDIELGERLPAYGVNAFARVSYDF